MIDQFDTRRQVSLPPESQRFCFYIHLYVFAVGTLCCEAMQHSYFGIVGTNTSQKRDGITSRAVITTLSSTASSTLMPLLPPVRASSGITCLRTVIIILSQMLIVREVDHIMSI